MSPDGREIIVKPRFMDRLFEIQQYQGRENEARGRAFVDAVFNFIYDIIGPQPLAFPTYVLSQYPDFALRRAVFRREYIIIYEVSAAEITLLTIFPARRNLADVEL